MTQTAVVTASREWHLTRRPDGVPVDEDFALVDVELPAPAGAEILVRNSFLSVDPYMRGRMNDARSYVPAFKLGQPMDGAAVGVVEQVGADAVDSNGTPIAVGDTVVHGLGWRTAALVQARSARVLDTRLAPAQAYLGVLGMPGLTAYAGLLRVGELAEGDRVFVSAAAGAVGSLVGQLARLKGASFVVGSAGGPEKTAWLLDEAGFDAAIDYKAMPIRMGLAQAAPEGIDVYFDNVGGAILDAALARLAMHARVVICGAISQYNNTGPAAGPANYLSLLVNRASMTGMLVFDYASRYREAGRELAAWMAAGRLQSREDVVAGIEKFPAALLMLFRGENTGKLMLDVSGD
jgi:NADPH-dependent curcumin reductase CurA